MGWEGGWEQAVKAEFTVHSFPTVVPSLVPSLTPTLANTSQPTDTPTLSPTVVNTPIGASLLPTLDPTFDPTTLPTLFPTLNPTLAPSEACFAAALAFRLLHTMLLWMRGLLSLLLARAHVQERLHGLAGFSLHAFAFACAWCLHGFACMHMLQCASFVLYTLRLRVILLSYLHACSSVYSRACVPMCLRASPGNSSGCACPRVVCLCLLRLTTAAIDKLAHVRHKRAHSFAIGEVDVLAHAHSHANAQPAADAQPDSHSDPPAHANSDLQTG